MSVGVVLKCLEGEQCPLYRFRIVGPDSSVKQFLLDSRLFRESQGTAITTGIDDRA